MASFYKSSSSSPPTHLIEEVTQEALLRNLSFPTFFSTPYAQNALPNNETLPPQNLPLTSFIATPFFQDVQPIEETIPRSLPMSSFISNPFFENAQPIPPTQIPNLNTINFNGKNVESSNLRKNISPRTRTTLFNIAPGIDIVQILIQFACVHSQYVSVIAGFGLVSKLDIRYPQPQYPPVQFSGNFQILTFSGIYNGCASSSSAPNVCPNYFVVKVESDEGEVIGGIIATSMIASSSVLLVITTCDTPTPSS